MLELYMYSRHEVPEEIAGQIRSYMRMQWPGVNNSTMIWPRLVEAEPAVHFVLMDSELLVAHASARIRLVKHNGAAYRVAGLSAVFAYPDYRGRGCGEQIARVATEHIRSSGADCAMLFCGDRVKSMYLRLGWRQVESARIAYGEPATIKTDNHVLMLVFSERGAQAQHVVESDVVHVGMSTW
ncbi:MAG TPA: GNAT family N-acetyltransferase [Tepidisphaeraceae bacterium]|jgi:GNAT superfamily N-acetyltransferase|nr:GNAT family N-acetyltransferase [Tepidisphaeraceae bacterium]